MVIKKLAVPFINEKLLSQAEHGYIASGGISEQGFDFVFKRLSIKCKVEIVTGLQLPTDPKVLRRVWKHFTDRVQLRVFTKNIFNPNVFIFDLPYRKAVAFIGSGNLSLGGLKDNEELFYKITDPREIESLKSWFTGYYEFAEPLTEIIIQEYEWIYPSLRQREIASRQEIKDVLELTTRGFNWDTIKFKNQYFKKEDFLTFANRKASLKTTEIQDERVVVQNKLLQIHESIKSHLSKLKLYEDHDHKSFINSLDPADYPDQRLGALWLSYGRSKAELVTYHPDSMFCNFIRIVIIITQKDVALWLMPGKENAGKVDREYFALKMNDPEYRKEFFQFLTALNQDTDKGIGDPSGYWIQIAGEQKPVRSFPNEDALWEFTRYDEWKYFAFQIGKNFSPANPEISMDHIVETILREFNKLILLYNYMKHNPSDVSGKPDMLSGKVSG